MLYWDDLCEEPPRCFLDRRTGGVSAQQVFGPLLERLRHQRRRPAEVQQNQAAFHDIWVRIQLRGSQTDTSQ